MYVDAVLSVPGLYRDQHHGTQGLINTLRLTLFGALGARGVLDSALTSIAPTTTTLRHHGSTTSGKRDERVFIHDSEANRSSGEDKDSKLASHDNNDSNRDIET